MFRIENWDDPTHNPIMNPKITAESNLPFVDFQPKPTTYLANPPTYIWTREELPESNVWGVTAILERDVPLKPRFSAIRSVTPEYLVEEETIQSVVVTFTLEEELPAGMEIIAVYIGFTAHHHALVNETVEYTVVEQKPTEDWKVEAEEYIGLPLVQWHTSPFMVELGRTYQFEATFKVRRVQVDQNPLISKPGVQIIYQKSIHEGPVVSKSATIEVPDIKVTFEADEEIEWGERSIYSDNYDFWINQEISSPEVPPEPTPETQERNQAGALIVNRWEFWSGTSEDGISNLPRIWNYDWFLILENQEDATHDPIMNPKITVESSLPFVNFVPLPTTYIAQPPTYIWTREDLLEGVHWHITAMLESDVAFKPRFSASRSVIPEDLVEEETIQTVMATFTLEEELPAGITDIWVYIGFGGLYAEMQEGVEYTVVEQKSTEGWQIRVADPPNQPGVQWYTFPFMVELGRTYQFEATFKVKKAQASQGSLICKPGFQIVYEKGIDEVPLVGKSVTIEVPDIKVTFEADEEIEWNRRSISDHYEIWVAPVIPSLEVPPEPTPETTTLPATMSQPETPPITTPTSVIFIPGFELLSVIAAIPVALYLTRQKK